MTRYHKTIVSYGLEVSRMVTIILLKGHRTSLFPPPECMNGLGGRGANSTNKPTLTITTPHPTADYNRLSLNSPNNGSTPTLWSWMPHKLPMITPTFLGPLFPACIYIYVVLLR